MTRRGHPQSQDESIRKHTCQSHTKPLASQLHPATTISSPLAPTSKPPAKSRTSSVPIWKDFSCRSGVQRCHLPQDGNMYDVPISLFSGHQSSSNAQTVHPLKFRQYTGDTDHIEHGTQFYQIMMMYSKEDDQLTRIYASSLLEGTFTWFQYLAPGRITSF